MKKFKISRKTIPIVICILLGVLLLYLFFLRARASELGEKLGSNMGIISGKLIGSVEGMTKGRDEGTEAGRQEGLRAKDTTATITTHIKQMGRLEVLVASVKLRNFHTIGERVSYAALYLVNGNIVFSVDFDKASIRADDNKLFVTLAEPVGELYIDQSTFQKITEYQKNSFAGNAEDGFDAFLNSMKEVQKASEKTIKNYDDLLDAAKNAAKNQVIMLVRAASIDYDEIIVDWDEEEQYE